MSLELVPLDSTENHFLSSARIKHSGVHIGDGVFLTANHYPTPGGGSKATLAQGLTAEEYLGRTTEYDFTLPDDPADWGPYTSGSLVHGAYDMALHTTNDPYTGDGAAASMIIFSDPEEMSGNIVNVGFPKYIPGTTDSNDQMYYSEGYLSEGSYSQHSLGGGFINTGGTGITIAQRMSGGGLFLEADPDGDGVSEHFLIGLTTRYSGATAVAGQYQGMADLLESLGRDSDDFPRHTLMSAQTLGSSHTTVTGTFFNEDIYGGVNADTLIGNGGTDHLTGGSGGDTFVFSSGDDNDTILDFSFGEDVLDFSGVEAPIFEVTQQGSDVLIEYGIQGDSVLLSNSLAENIETLVPTYNVIDGRGTGKTPLWGTSGQDVILAEGGTGHNAYLFGAGGNAGADIFVSLGGPSYLLYRESTVGLTIDLENRVAHGGNAEGDTWVGEWTNIQGSNYDDVFLGSTGDDFVWLYNGNDQFYGHGGDDKIRLSGGVDYIDGGAGYDQVLYSWHHKVGQIIDIYNENDVRKTADMNTYISVEHLIAHKRDDVINIGSDTTLEVVDGERGNDTFNVYANSGTFIGGSGADEFHFTPDDLMSSQTNITVADFDTSIDSLSIMGNSFELDGPQELPEGFSYGSDSTGNLVINFGDDDMITFTDVDSLAFI